MDKRRLLLTTQTICMALAALLGVLTLLDVVVVWTVVVLAFAQGAALSFDQPTRAALVSELVPKEDLLNAFSLQSIVFTGASTIGPALDGEEPGQTRVGPHRSQPFANRARARRPCRPMGWRGANDPQCGEHREIAHRVREKVPGVADDGEADPRYGNGTTLAKLVRGVGLRGRHCVVHFARREAGAAK